MTAASTLQGCARITSNTSRRPLRRFCGPDSRGTRGDMKLPLLAAVAAVAALLSVAHAQEEVKGAAPASSAPAEAATTAPAETATSGAPEVGSGGMPDAGAG